MRTIAGSELEARLVMVGDEASGVDLALLEISDSQFGEDLLAISFARIDRDRPAPVPGCWAVGFPQFSEAGPVLPEGSHREPGRFAATSCRVRSCNRGCWSCR